MKNRILYLLISILALSSSAAAAPQVDIRERNEIARVLTRIVGREVTGADVRVQVVKASKNRVQVYASVGLSYYPFRERNVRAMYDSVRAILPVALRKAQIELYTDKREVRELIPMAFRTGPQPRKEKDREVSFTNAGATPLVRRLARSAEASKGLSGRHIALWQSHGRYFDQAENRWRWQRVRLWETCEDLYTQSYVLPYLVPMLENAGANVLLPRERDVQMHEVLADNDAREQYTEQDGDQRWGPGGVGFAHRRQVYLTGENPFREGTTRRVKTVTGGAESHAVWTSDIPQRGEYAVYVSYESTPGSADDALYTVRHLGGESRFAVNQTMGGGTWIYLGMFDFAPGVQQAVTLSNRSARAGRTVSADAVKIGGGFGNVARTPCDSIRQSDRRGHPGREYAVETSGYPRFCEGARYWLQWAGFGETVYAPKHHKDDYKEDYMSRAHWVNALMGGSARLPDSAGLRIPVDMALAFHSDAGVRPGDEIVGTLGIFCTRENQGRFEGGADRYRSRDLTDIVMTQIVDDIRGTWEPEWRRRGLWNRAYYEARMPACPTMLLELLSHQNFADMRYGSDPRFKFLVSRAVYKGILRFLASQYGTPCVVQPLPVGEMAAEFIAEAGEAGTGIGTAARKAGARAGAEAGKAEAGAGAATAGEAEAGAGAGTGAVGEAGLWGVRLSWEATPDPLEPTALPTGYVVYTRIGDGGFDGGRYTDRPEFTTQQYPGVIYSYRVTAVNDGGESFPSETLAVCRVPDEKGRVLIVNGFDRVSAPQSSDCDSLAGFYHDIDGGVPDRRDISFIGKQCVFDRSKARVESETRALGSSECDCETDIIGGNTFDYPALHGASVAAAGYSFCSAARRAVESGRVRLTDYRLVDLILSKQRTTQLARGVTEPEFRAFTPALKQAVREFIAAGGGIFVSGAYVASDLWESAGATDDDRVFARQTLGYALDRGRASDRGRVRVVSSRPEFSRGEYRFHDDYGPDHYLVEAPDGLKPAGEGAFALMRYIDGGRTAVVAAVGEGRTVVAGFPFESLTTQLQRDRMMGDILKFITTK